MGTRARARAHATLSGMRIAIARRTACAYTRLILNQYILIEGFKWIRRRQVMPLEIRISRHPDTSICQREKDDFRALLYPRILAKFPGSRKTFGKYSPSSVCYRKRDGRGFAASARYATRGIEGNAKYVASSAIVIARRDLIKSAPG